MRFLFIVDPLPELAAYKDSSVAMMRAASARGHEVWAATTDVLAWESADGVRARALPSRLLSGHWRGSSSS